MSRMADISGVVRGLRREEKALKKRLKNIGKALKAFKGLGAVVASVTGSKPQRHTAKSRKAIARAKKKWWADRKKAGKV